MKAITIYYHPSMCMAHIITSNVNEETGEHVVVKSVLIDGVSHLHNVNPTFLTDMYVKLYGVANVHTYTCKEGM